MQMLGMSSCRNIGPYQYQAVLLTLQSTHPPRVAFDRRATRIGNDGYPVFATCIDDADNVFCTARVQDGVMRFRWVVVVGRASMFYQNIHFGAYLVLSEHVSEIVQSLREALCTSILSLNARFRGMIVAKQLGDSNT
jgi:hypothetical protein